MIPKDAPRCPKCGVRLPMHAVGCPEIRPPLSDAEFDPLFEAQQERDELPGKDARDCIEVVERSRFSTEGHDDCDCMSCRPYTS